MSRRRPRAPVIVSDHALVRFFERVCGLDTDAARARVLPPDIAGFIQGNGDGEYRVTGDGHSWRVVVKNKVVVTVVEG